MLIIKQETQEIVDRQLRMFALAEMADRPRVSRHWPGGYEYAYLPGQPPETASIVVEYLARAVWPKDPLPGDAGDYLGYIRGLEARLGVHLPPAAHAALEGLIGGARPCLVHGDATLENFVQTRGGLTPIDFGLARGLCFPENDQGKLLQSTLTHWAALRHGAAPVPAPDGAVPVNNATVAALLTHWLRIIKNADRHPPAVEGHGRLVVIPALAEMLGRRSRLPLRCGWDAASIREAHYRCLPPGAAGAGRARVD